MAWVYVIFHVLLHTDTAFLTLRAEGFGQASAVILCISLSSLTIIFLYYCNRIGIGYFSGRYKSFQRVQFAAVLYLNSIGRFIQQKLGHLGFNYFVNGVNGSQNFHKAFRIVSYGLVDRLGYLGVAILNSIPIIPGVVPASIAGGQLIGLRYTLAVSLFFNALRIIWWFHWHY